MNLLPLLTHFLLATLYLAVLGVPAFMAAGLPGVVAAGFVVSAFFYGREAGQREHDLKNAGTGAIMAWLGSLLMFRWSLDNLLQWASPTVAVVLALISYTLWHLAHLPAF